MRKYEGWACDVCGAFYDTEPLGRRCRADLAAHNGVGVVEMQAVTAVDLRDVEPLVGALRFIAELESVVPAPDGSGPMIVMRDSEMRDRASAALAAFEEED